MGGCGVSRSTFGVRDSWDSGGGWSRKASQGTACDLRLHAANGTEQNERPPLMFTQHNPLSSGTGSGVTTKRTCSDCTV